MKVLILHASAGAGHQRAAEALGRAFSIHAPEVEAMVLDMLDFTSGVFKAGYAKGYLNLIRTAPELWGYMYSRADKKSQEPIRRRLRILFNKLNTRAFRKFFRETDPDAVVCTHFLPLEVVAEMISEGVTAVPLHCVITDFAVHALWRERMATRYYVANDEARRNLVRHGRSPESVRITGIPVDPAFAHRKSRDRACAELGIDPHIPSVLVLGGGYGVGPTLELARSFIDSPTPVRLLLVAGRNPKLQARLQDIAARLPVAPKVFGHVNNIHTLMDASDLLLTKPGGLTISEALAKGLPMMLLDPIPGQEQRNCEHLLEEGAALRIHEPADAPHKIGRLLQDDARMAALRENIARIARPHAARDIVLEVAGGLNGSGPRTK